MAYLKQIECVNLVWSAADIIRARGSDLHQVQQPFFCSCVLWPLDVQKRCPERLQRLSQVYHLQNLQQTELTY